MLQNPHDFAARGVYADWLGERGNEQRAEFIQLQLQLASLEKARQFANRRDPDPDPKLLKALRDRTSDLLAAGNCGLHWLEQYTAFEAASSRPSISGNAVQIIFNQLPGLPTPRWEEWRYYGGWPELLRCSMSFWEMYGKDIVSRMPLLNVDIADRAPATGTVGPLVRPFTEFFRAEAPHVGVCPGCNLGQAGSCPCVNLSIRQHMSVCLAELSGIKSWDMGLDKGLEESLPGAHGRHWWVFSFHRQHRDAAVELFQRACLNDARHRAGLPLIHGHWSAKALESRGFTTFHVAADYAHGPQEG